MIFIVQFVEHESPVQIRNLNQSYKSKVVGGPGQVKQLTNKKKKVTKTCGPV